MQFQWVSTPKMKETTSLVHTKSLPVNAIGHGTPSALYSKSGPLGFKEYIQVLVAVHWVHVLYVVVLTKINKSKLVHKRVLAPLCTLLQIWSNKVPTVHPDTVEVYCSVYHFFMDKHSLLLVSLYKYIRSIYTGPMLLNFRVTSNSLLG